MPNTPLTDAIEALTTYANTVTGKTPPDTTLSDAVATLASGYGGGGGSFETGVLVGDGLAHSSYVTIPVSKQCSNFILLIEGNPTHASGDYVGCWGTPTAYMGVRWTNTGVNGNISFDNRGIYLKFSADKIQFMTASNGAYNKLILNANYNWIAW